MARHETGPSVLFSKLAWQKMWALVHACKIEISWMGIVATDEEREEAGVDEDFWVKDIYVVDQECTGVKSDLKPEAVAGLCNTLLDEDIDPSRLKLWGHSHVNMDTGFSGTDEATIERLQLEPLISIVLNKRGEVNIRVDTWEPWRHSYDCTYDVEEIQMLPPSWGEEMVKKHVEIHKPVFTGKKTKTSKTTNHWFGDRSWDDFGYGGFSSTAYNSKEKKPSPMSLKEEQREEALQRSEVLEDAQSELTLCSELVVLEELFAEGSISINELLEYTNEFAAGVKTANEITAELIESFNVVNDSDLIAGGVFDEEESFSEDPFYVDENPSNEAMEKTAEAK